jgi:hypothetical protein
MPNGLPALQAFLQEQFEGRFNVTQVTATLTTAQSQILTSNFERMAVVIVNQSGSVVFVNLGQFVNLTTGIQLAPNGGALFMNMRDDLILPGVEMFAWSAIGSATITVLTVFRTAGTP